MITVSQARTTHTQVSLTSAEAREVTMQYVRKEVLKGGYVTDDGRLEDWTSEPHGSGTTTDHGPATPLQRAAAEFLKQLQAEQVAGQSGITFR